ncbi:MAG: isoprenylcysteine carboxylmethyltransferase family protein [Brevundimonas sp.]|uniref:methyltransferase family protein n=1 Tax=Brevundimonas sp. TaxID=1871086 RepID=UPI0027362E70|nr:isoprenylcysteine carboxylmethyltransferase family protein [Brevundimonas sp.]MDP3406014.1 isoprenylcysteine carboxylmethyltransferase family protein [Brevundimonas sp.]
MSHGRPVPQRDHPGVIAPPPLIFLGFLLLGWGLGEVIAEPGLGLADTLRRGLAVAGLLVGLGIEGWAAGLFRRARTAVQPWKPSTALVTTGIYGLTRNPIYLGFAITYVGLAIGLDSPLALILLIPCLVVVDRFVIRREERYLQARFGADYDRYRQRVRRWL